MTKYFKVAGTSYLSIKAAYDAAQASMYVVHAVEGPSLFSAVDGYRAVLQPVGCVPTICNQKVSCHNFFLGVNRSCLLLCFASGCPKGFIIDWQRIENPSIPDASCFLPLTSVGSAFTLIAQL
jgi:hypothetical protein